MNKSIYNTDAPKFENTTVTNIFKYVN